MITTRRLQDIPVMETLHRIDARNIYNTKDSMITIITLKPGESLKRHSTPVDVVFFVLEGEGVVEIGEEKMSVDKNTLIESPKDIIHCWYNESKNDVRFMVIKLLSQKRGQE